MPIVHVCAVCGALSPSLVSHAGGIQFHPEVMHMAEDYVPDRRLYLAEDGETVVEEGDPRAASLLAVPGIPVAAADVERYKLKELGKKQAVVEDKAAEPGEDKAANPQSRGEAAPHSGTGSGDGPPRTTRR